MKSCILCGNQSNRVVYSDERLTVIQCLACGLTRQSDYAAAIARLNTHFTGSDAYYARRESFTETKIGLNQSRVNRKADILERIVTEFSPELPVLDVGSGSGEFMQALQTKGLSVVGVEPSVSRSTYARERLGLNVVTAFYEEVLFAPGSFGVISFIQVLEHVENPIESLSIAHKHLDSNGYLIVEVPGYNNPRFIMYKLTRQKKIVRRDFIPSHNYYYTRKTLSQIVEAAGFCVLDVITGRYAVKYGHKHRLLKIGLGPVDRLANLLGIGGITLYAQKV